MDDLIFDLVQNSRIRQLEGETRSARHDAAGAKNELRELTMRFERLNLVTNALWKLLKKQTGLRDLDLQKIVDSIDLKDGIRDGRISRSSNERIPCSGCSRRIPKTAMACYVCGTENPYYVSL